jgi:hypothetical protein
MVSRNIPIGGKRPVGSSPKLGAAGAASSFRADDGRTWTVMRYKDELHIMPKHGPRRHRLFGCWCHPIFDRDQRALSPVWVHSSAPP